VELSSDRFENESVVFWGGIGTLPNLLFLYDCGVGSAHSTDDSMPYAPCSLRRDNR
jgi:hypothetical protein